MLFKNRRLSKFALTVFLCFQGIYTQVQAKELLSSWTKISIPGAVCGDGQEYKVFLRKGDPQKLAFGFSGGGACWSSNTCFGPFAMASLKPTEQINLKEGIFSLDSEKSSLSDFTHIYFPYCTGDVFMGSHEASYGKKKVHHKGRVQVELTLEYLKKQKILHFEEASDVVLFGFSAGAIASLFHVTSFDRYLADHTQKFVLSDAPGMHFGKTFWKKFPPAQLEDYTEGFRRIGMELNIEEGHVAKQIPKYCQKFANWRIGVLQGSKDFVMSTVFGNISAGEHHRLVTGENGVYKLTESTGDNCSAWVPTTSTHTFLMKDSTAEMTIANKKAIEFANDIVLNMDDENYKE